MFTVGGLVHMRENARASISWMFTFTRTSRWKQVVCVCDWVDRCVDLIDPLGASFVIIGLQTACTRPHTNIHELVVDLSVIASCPRKRPTLNSTISTNSRRSSASKYNHTSALGYCMMGEHPASRLTFVKHKAQPIYEKLALSQTQAWFYGHGKSWQMERVMEKSWNFNHLFSEKNSWAAKINRQMENLAYGKKCNQNAPFSDKNLKNFLGRPRTLPPLGREIPMTRPLTLSIYLCTYFFVFFLGGGALHI